MSAAARTGRPTSPWRGEVATQGVAGGGGVFRGGGCTTPPRRFAPTLPLQGRVKRATLMLGERVP
jgi:hypothetical protein